ncbi:MAG: coproporphyrinogen III oxidase, partial [Bacteroidetes bacterium]|nr:coproporphyrinogen III oxidase [Bacteroidota bacterium]
MPRGDTVVDFNNVLGGFLRNDLAIYVHWPWCKAKCPYCDFNSHAGMPREEEYVAAVCAELAWWRAQGLGERRLVSVFFGGGTPSLMRPASIARILAAVAPLGRGLEQAEITVECNPTSSSLALFE